MKRSLAVLLIFLLAVQLSLPGCTASGFPWAWKPATPTSTQTATPAPSATPSPVPSLTPRPTTTLAPCPAVPGQHACASDVLVGSPASGSHITRIRYLLYLPGDYGKDPAKKWPLILFLHGSGEIGETLSLLKGVPLPQWLETKTDFPFIVISPQLPGMAAFTTVQSTYNIPTWTPLIDPLNQLLDEIPANYAVDTRRIYLTGLSLGGFGTWEFALRYPQRFAAIVPIAGGYQFQSNMVPGSICKLKDLPIWVFHGAQDTSVSVKQSQVLVDALNACGSDVHFTIYPDAGHSGAWLSAYADPGLWQWLAEQTLK
jgi:predicted peptidase